MPSLWPAGRLFTGVADPRVERTRRHRLCDILLIALWATLAGAEGFCDMAAWAQAKEGWLRTFLELPGGVPSHDTMARVFARLDPKQRHAAFLRWLDSASERGAPGQIAVDGKTLRRRFDGASGQRPLHVVSAFADGLGLVPGPLAVTEKSNEIAAIPEFLRLLDVAGAVVTIDAMGTHKEIAAQIIAQGGDYVLALKANHPVLHADAQRFFDDAPTLQGWLRARGSQARSVEKDHGRIEERTAWALPVEALLGGLRGLSAWPGLRSLCAVASRRESTTNGTASAERRYFLSRLAPDATRLLALVRGHWAIENKLPWALDVHLGEDRCRARKEHAPLNLATLRRVALSLAQRDTQSPTSVRLPLKRAGWDDAYLFGLLNI